MSSLLSTLLIYATCPQAAGVLTTLRIDTKCKQLCVAILSRLYQLESKTVMFGGEQSAVQTQQGRTIWARVMLPALSAQGMHKLFPGHTWGYLWCNEGLLPKDV